ncbi:MAG: 5-formyltetrahydrofolate cyclo-ligase [Acidimicrobiales bacterium]|nr:5-formyltetrahydrofolate cyclo-ligase [Hyphomonadaceae bacterium]RZV42932.1 MAG: 5-formyltetrahydrofolate cyclo-ligase [Acidimicrobiales bacterium]
MAFLALEKTKARNAAKMSRRQAAIDTPAAAIELIQYWPEIGRKSGIVAIYLPIQSELNPGPLSGALVDAGYQLALPCIKRAAHPLEFRLYRPGDKLRGGPYNTREPVKTAYIVDPDIVLLPMLAFSTSGYRLGYGGGFYDRTLQSLRAQKEIFACGLAYAAQEVPLVPTDEYDQKLDGVLTEREFRKF